jgi:hypothetical protein
MKWNLATGYFGAQYIQAGDGKLTASVLAGLLATAAKPAAR